MLQKNIESRNVKKGLFVFPIFLLCGCFYKQLDTLENQYFKYIVVDSSMSFGDIDVKKKSISIVGFTEFALQQKTIEIPREIDNLPVRYIGWKDTSTYSEHYESPIVPEDCSLNKIYFYENVERIIFEEFNNAKLFNCSLNNIEICGGGVDSYACFDLAEFSNRYMKANVAFLLNNESSSNPIYRIDNIANGENLDIPPVPTRDGFLFNGWYLETECINKYNFEASFELEENQTLMLYANWIK